MNLKTKIMKTKILKFSILTAILGIALWSCKKEEDNSKTPNPEITEGIRMEFNYNGISNLFQADSPNGFLNWKRESSEQSYNMNIILGNQNEEIIIKEKGENYITYSYKGDIYKMENIRIDENIFTSTISGKNLIQIDFKIEDESNSFISKFNDIKINEAISLNPNSISRASNACPWCLVAFGAAALINSAVDYYCDNKIASDVATCTANGKCSVVNSCSATCVNCPE